MPHAASTDIIAHSLVLAEPGLVSLRIVSSEIRVVLGERTRNMRHIMYMEAPKEV